MTMNNNKVNLEDGLGFVELLDYMRDLQTVVKDARQSYNRKSDVMDNKDYRLLRFLMENKHNSPLRGVVFRFNVKAPIFVARQWWKHVIGSTNIEAQNGWNEVSGRYIRFKPEFFIPRVFRQNGAYKDNWKQKEVPGTKNLVCRALYRASIDSAFLMYQSLLTLGVSKEQARMVLPNSLYTTFTWTVSLEALMHFIALRNKENAQPEIKRYAEAILIVLPEEFRSFFDDYC
jgi:thymidylate synthase (FAD)